MCCRPWGPKESDTTEWLTLSLSLKTRKSFINWGFTLRACDTSWSKESVVEEHWAFYLILFFLAPSLSKDPDSVHVSMLLCSCSTLSSPTPSRVHESVFYVCISIAALQIHSTIYETDSQWEFALWFRELKSGLCDNLEGWDGEGGGREVQEGGHMCTPMADSRWCMAEPAHILKLLSFNWK